MGFKHGFGDKAGRNTANALFNLFGIDFSDRRRVSIDTSRKIKAEARANLDNTRAEIERQNQLYALDAAVLDNVDQVVGLVLSTEPNELCAELSALQVQLETNSWGIATDEENKIRNKYTNAVFSKFKSGVRQLEIIDPNNPRIDDFQAAIRKARWRKFFGAYWFILFIASPFLLFFIAALLEEDSNLWSDYWWIIIGIIVVIVGLIIFSAIRRAKKRKDRIIAYTMEHSTQPQAETPLASSPAPQPSISPTPSAEHSVPKPADYSGEQFEPHASISAAATSPTQPRPDVIHESIGREEPITSRSGLSKRYSKIWEKYTSIGEIMNRGFATNYIAKQKDFLVLGFNSQYSITESNSVYILTLAFHGYWGEIYKMVFSRALDLTNNFQYLDLFAFRESNQEVAIRDVIQNPALFPYVVEQVCLTQEIIESVVAPRVIVVKDKASWAFLGKLPQFTWMGYSFEHLQDTPYGEVCKIKGFTTKKDRINKQFEHSNIEGARILFLEPKDDGDLPTPQFLESLLSM